MERKILRRTLYVVAAGSLFVATFTYFDYSHSQAALAPAWISFVVAVGALSITAGSQSQPAFPASERQPDL